MNNIYNKTASGTLYIIFLNKKKIGNFIFIYFFTKYCDIISTDNSEITQTYAEPTDLY